MFQSNQPGGLWHTVNSGEAFDNDGTSSQVPWLKGGVLPAGTLAIVVISHHHPRQTIGLHTHTHTHTHTQSITNIPHWSDCV